MSTKPTPERTQLLKQARSASLLKIWLAGRRQLTPAELAEIQHLLPSPPPADESTERLTLNSAAPPPRRLTNFYKKKYSEYCVVYDVGERAIKHWVAEGKACKPADLPPLDEPEKMAAWWRRVKPAQKPPDIMLEYECSARKAKPEAPTPPSDSQPGKTPGESGEAEDDGSITSIDLGEMSLLDDEDVQQARQLVKANFQRVSAASKGGNSDDYRRWFPIWKGSVDQLRTLEKAAIERRKNSGKYLAREPILAELSQLIESLRHMHTAMPEKIMAALEENAHGRFRRVLSALKPQIADAIKKVREKEVNILMNVPALETTPAPPENTLTLEAAA